MNHRSSLVAASTACLFLLTAALPRQDSGSPSTPAEGRIPDAGEEGRLAQGEGSWLTGTTEEKLAQIERHLRGLDVAMAEIAYRYGELLVGGEARNWEYAKYQIEKIDLSLRLAIERRPKRAESSRTFLEESVPPVMEAIAARDEAALDDALAKLHAGCVECHRSENVLHFKDAVDRIRDRVQ